MKSFNKGRNSSEKALDSSPAMTPFRPRRGGRVEAVLLSPLPKAEVIELLQADFVHNYHDDKNGAVILFPIISVGDRGFTRVEFSLAKHAAKKRNSTEVDVSEPAMDAVKRYQTLLEVADEDVNISIWSNFEGKTKKSANAPFVIDLVGPRSLTINSVKDFCKKYRLQILDGDAGIFDVDMLVVGTLKGYPEPFVCPHTRVILNMKWGSEVQTARQNLIELLLGYEYLVDGEQSPRVATFHCEYETWAVKTRLSPQETAEMLGKRLPGAKALPVKASAEDRLPKLEQRKAELLQQLVEPRAVARMARRCEELEKSLANAQANVTQREQKFLAASGREDLPSGAVMKLETKLKAVDEQIEQARSVVETVKADYSVILQAYNDAKKFNKVARLQQQITEKDREIQSYDDLRLRAETTLQLAGGVDAEATAQIRTAKAEIALLEKSKAELRRRIEEAELEITEPKAKIAVAEKHLGALLDQRTALVATVPGYSERELLEEAEAELSKFEEALKKCREEFEKTKANNDRVQALLPELSSTIEKLKAEVKAAAKARVTVVSTSETSSDSTALKAPPKRPVNPQPAG